MKEISPGIFEMTMEEYVKYPAYSRSVLVAALESAGHALAVETQPKDETDAMRLGTATHAAFLEPAEVAKHFSLYRGKPTEKEGQLIFPKTIVRRGNHWEAHKKNALSQGMDPHLTLTQYEHALSMGEALRLHRKTRTLFERKPVRREVVIVFSITALGVEIPIKVRIDSLIQDEFPTLVDLKTAADISDFSFTQSIIRYGYDIQAWLYRKAFIARTKLDITNFVIAAVEKDQKIAVGSKLTHAVRVIEMEVWLPGGQQRGLQALGVIARGIQTGDWPAYPDQVETLDPPKWYQKQYGGIR